MSRDTRHDLHGNVPDTAHTGLLIVDMINEFSFPDAATMFPAIIGMAERIAALKRRVKAAGFPVIYVNDNFGKWQSDFRKLVARCLEEPCRGKEVTTLLRPEDDDYFVLKPKHSGFYATPLELLLTYLKARRLILTGMAAIAAFFTQRPMHTCASSNSPCHPTVSHPPMHAPTLRRWNIWERC
jgi:nicotinamidase-related amidase